MARSLTKLQAHTLLCAHHHTHARTLWRTTSRPWLWGSCHAGRPCPRRHGASGCTAASTRRASAAHTRRVGAATRACSELSGGGAAAHACGLRATRAANGTRTCRTAAHHPCAACAPGPAWRSRSTRGRSRAQTCRRQGRRSRRLVVRARGGRGGSAAARHAAACLWPPAPPGPVTGTRNTLQGPPPQAARCHARCAPHTHTCTCTCTHTHMQTHVHTCTHTCRSAPCTPTTHTHTTTPPNAQSTGAQPLTLLWRAQVHEHRRDALAAARGVLVEVIVEVVCCRARAATARALGVCARGAAGGRRD
jgi:hypothetical protein